MNHDLAESTVRHQVYLEGLKSGEVKRFDSFLKKIDASVRDRLSKSELTDFSRKRLEVLLASIDSALNKIFAEHYGDLKQELLDLSVYESEFEVRNLEQLFDDSGIYTTLLPAATQVEAAVFSSPLSVRGAGGGKLLEPFVKDWSGTERDRIVGAIRQGAFEGQTNSQIIQAIRGTRKNKFKDGILATTTRNASAITRTAVQHVSSIARMKTWEANQAVVDGYRWVSTLDGRTTAQCRTLDGKNFDVGSGPMPPIHIGCRSTTVAELREDLAFLSEGRTRSSKDGYVNANETYYSWLKKQPAAFQNDVLGKTRAKLFRDGGLNAERFSALNLDRNFKPLTLEQMKIKEPQAFIRAEI